MLVANRACTVVLSHTVPLANSMRCTTLYSALLPPGSLQYPPTVILSAVPVMLNSRSALQPQKTL